MGAVLLTLEAKTVARSRQQHLVRVETESEAAFPSRASRFQFHSEERRVFDIYVQLLDRRHKDMATAGLAPQYGREKLNHRRAADRPAFVEPGAVAGDPPAAMAAMARVPAFHGGPPPLLRPIGRASFGERVCQSV